MHDLDLARLSFPQALRALYQSQAGPAAEGSTPWLDRLEASCLQWPLLALASGRPLADPRPGLWTTDAAHGLRVFVFVTEHSPGIGSVAFPIPENRIGLRALWYWRRRGA